MHTKQSQRNLYRIKKRIKLWRNLGIGSDLSVEHDGTLDLGVLHRHPEVIERLLVVLVRPVREIEPGDVHPRPQKLLDHRYRPRRRSQRAHDLRLWDPPVARQLLQDPLDVDIRHCKASIFTLKP